MRSRLTFPSAGMETKYVWDRHNIQNNGIYKWDKHNVINKTEHYWDKYSTLNEKSEFQWSRYEINPVEYHEWHRYSVTPTDEYVENVWATDEVEYDYINFAFNGDFEVKDNRSVSMITGYITLFGLDKNHNEYKKVLDVAELFEKKIVIWNLCYSRLWYGASYSETLSQANSVTKPDFIGQVKLAVANHGTDANGNKIYKYNLMGTKIISGNLYYVYWGAPINNLSNQLNIQFGKKAKLVSQNIYPRDDSIFINESIVDGSFSSITEFQNTSYLSINDNLKGYKINFDNYEVVTSLSSTAYPNGTELGPNFDTPTYFYVYNGSNTVYEKGDYIDTITSLEDGVYPEDGVYEGYWYETLKSHIWNKYEIITDPVYRWDAYKARNKEYFVAERYNRIGLTVASNNDWGPAISGDQTGYVNGWQIHLWNIPADEKITIYGLNKGITGPSPVDEVEMTLREFAQIGNTGGITPRGMRPFCNIMGLSLLGKTYIIHGGGDASFFMPCSINNADNTCDLGICSSYYGLWEYNIDKGLSNSNGDTVVYLAGEHETPNRTYTNIELVVGMYGEPEEVEIIEGEDSFEDAKISELRNYPFKAVYYNPYGTEEYYYFKIKTLNTLDDEFMPDTDIDPIQVTSLSEDTYPEDGYQDGKWYKYTGYSTESSPGTYLGQVFDTNIYAYPDNGAQDSYWYIYHSSIKDQGHYVWDKYKLKYTYKWSKQPVIYKEVIDLYNYTNSAIYFYTNEEITKTHYVFKDGTPTNWQNLTSDTEIILYGFAPEEGYCLYTDSNPFLMPKRLTFTIQELYEWYFENIQNNDYEGYIPLYLTWMMGFAVRGKTYCWEQKENSSSAYQADRYFFKISKNGASYNVEMKCEVDSTSTYMGIWELSLYDAFTKGQFSSSYKTDKYGYQYYYDYALSAPRGRLLTSNNPSDDLTSFDTNSTGQLNYNFNIMKQCYLLNFPFKGFRNIETYSSNYYSGYKTRYPSDMYFTEDKKVDTTAPIEYIYDTDSSKYPSNDYQGNYFYKKLTNETTTSYGEFIDKVYSTTASLYPLDGKSGSYWYIYTGVEPIAPVKKDAYLGQVVSTDKNYYPADNYQGSYWYVYTGSQLFQYKGSFIEVVDSENRYTYPTDGVKSDYWYVYEGFENNGPYKSRWVDEVETNNKNTYPTDGISGNYWYVYKKSYNGYKLQINDENLKGGINYKHNINPEEDFMVGCVSSAEIDFEYDNTLDDFEKYIAEDYCDYYTWQPEDNDWRLIGRFWLDDVSYQRTSAKVKAFDAVLACDIYVDEFINNTTFPISLINFFNNLCKYCGVSGIINAGVTNTTKVFEDNFEAINITARQLFQYIAEMAGGFIVADTQGRLVLTSYTNTQKTLDNTKYTTYARQRYTVEPISGLTVRMNTDDLGVSSGNVEDNPYIIENNPLFYTNSVDEIMPAVSSLYQSIGNKAYRPAEVELLQDFGINCGDIIDINGDTFYVMDKELSASGCKLKCYGNQYRAKQPTSINADIIALRGKTNELYRDLEMTQSTLTDRANGLQSQITQTAEEINLRVTNEVAGLESEISQTAEQISSRVTNEVAGLESKITQTADSITSSVTDEINQAKSEIKQTTDSISLEVQNQGDLVAQLVLDVDGISAKGYVTFTDLAGSGTTTINGDNITTGTISADRINLTGSISWGDLTQSCKNTIASYAGDSDLPDYIHSTYIDATTIKSPTIQGGTLYAGNVWEGYCRMTSSGLNVVSDTGGNICGIGWHPGYYNLPYVVLGSGVDNVGTDQGLIKKYTHGIWIGDSDSIFASNEQVPTSGTGIFVDFVEGKIYKYINGTKTQL